MYAFIRGQHTSETLKNEVRSFCGAQMTMIQQIENSNEEETCVKKFPNWKHLLNSRKIEFWKHYKTSKITEIYSSWLEKTTPVIPRKFQPKPITGETDAQNQVRNGFAVNQMKCETEILKIRANNAKSQYEAMDLHMKTTIEEIFPDNTTLQAKFKAFWTQQCQQEENKSKSLWETKKEFYMQQELEDSPDNSNAVNTNSNDKKFSRASDSIKFRKPNQPANRRNNAPQHRNQRERRETDNRKPVNRYNTQYQQSKANVVTQPHIHRTPRIQMQRQDSITEDIIENYPPSIPRTLSDSFLPRGRPPNEALD